MSQWYIRPMIKHEESDVSDGFELVDEHGVVVADNQTYYPTAMERHHAERIVACVNAQSTDSPMGRLSKGEPNLQNIPVPRTKEGIEAERVFKKGRGNA